MTRISFQNVLDILEETKQQLIEAGGKDKQISNEDFRKLIEAEPDRQKRAFLRIFNTFLRIIGGDRPRMRLTHQVLEDGLSYIKNELLPHFEIADTFTTLTNQKLAQLKPAAFPFAMELLRTTREQAKLSTAEVAELIGNNVVDLFFDDFGSEASEPIQPFFQEASLEALTAETFRKALNLKEGDPKEAIARFEPADEPLRVFVEQHAPFGLQQKAAFIVELMQQNLTDLSVIILGEDYNADVPPNHPVYVVGIGKDGDLAGFRSEVIWT